MNAPRWYDHREPATYGQQAAWQAIYDACEEALSPQRQWTRDVDQVTDAQGTYTVASYGAAACGDDARGARCGDAAGAHAGRGGVARG